MKTYNTAGSIKNKISTPEQKLKLKKHLSDLNSKLFQKEFRAKLSEGTSNFNRLTKSKKVVFTDIKTGLNLTFSSQSFKF